MTGSAFLAWDFFFWGMHDLKKARFAGSAFLAGAFVSWEIHDLEKSQGDWVSVPSRGFCLLEKDDQENS